MRVLAWVLELARVLELAWVLELELAWVSELALESVSALVLASAWAPENLVLTFGSASQLSNY